MATPVPFNGHTHVLRAPKGATAEECGSLPVRVAHGVFTSCWELTPAEQAEAFATGRLWVQVWSGHTQPPIRVSIERPF